MSGELRQPTSEDLAVLSPFERLAVRLVRRMNTRPWKQLWLWPQRELNARLIHFITHNRLVVHGLEHVVATSRERPLVVVANHRSLFDLYVATAVLFRRLPGWREIYFPVRGRFFYQNPVGVLLNLMAAWWAMYPPFFHRAIQKRFDQHAMRALVDLCREGPGRLIGFHPEGTRNRGTDPYSYLPPQPGIGRLIMDARPQVVPIFVAGLSNSFWAQARANWLGGEPVRLYFGPPVEYEEFLSKPEALATYRELAEMVMSRIRMLGEMDRSLQSAGDSHHSSAPLDPAAHPPR